MSQLCQELPYLGEGHLAGCVVSPLFLWRFSLG
jgi:hypothetical protein